MGAEGGIYHYHYYGEDEDLKDLLGLTELLGVDRDYFYIEGGTHYCECMDAVDPNYPVWHEWRDTCPIITLRDLLDFCEGVIAESEDPELPIEIREMLHLKISEIGLEIDTRPMYSYLDHLIEVAKSRWDADYDNNGYGFLFSCVEKNLEGLKKWEDKNILELLEIVFDSFSFSHYNMAWT